MVHSTGFAFLAAVTNTLHLLCTHCFPGGVWHGSYCLPALCQFLMCLAPSLTAVKSPCWTHSPSHPSSLPTLNPRRLPLHLSYIQFCLPSTAAWRHDYPEIGRFILSVSLSFSSLRKRYRGVYSVATISQWTSLSPSLFVFPINQLICRKEPPKTHPRTTVSVSSHPFLSLLLPLSFQLPDHSSTILCHLTPPPFFTITACSSSIFAPCTLN